MCNKVNIFRIKSNGYFLVARIYLGNNRQNTFKSTSQFQTSSNKGSRPIPRGNINKTAKIY